MKGYGTKRDWNSLETAIFKNASRASAEKHTKIKKRLHRSGRRVAKHNLRKEIREISIF